MGVPGQVARCTCGARVVHISLPLRRVEKTRGAYENRPTRRRLSWRRWRTPLWEGTRAGRRRPGFCARLLLIQWYLYGVAILMSSACSGVDAAIGVPKHVLGIAMMLWLSDGSSWTHARTLARPSSVSSSSSFQPPLRCALAGYILPFVGRRATLFGVRASAPPFRRG
jgi:hypothetical protein